MTCSTKPSVSPVEAVLGRDGVGLADCAIAESKFEKGEDVTGGCCPFSRS